MDNDLVQLLRSVIREELVPVKDEVSSVKEELVTVNERLDRMEIEQQSIKQDQELIKRAVLETNERLINVESLLENQHRIIELLSVRSIDQEAQLKRIK